MDDLRMAYAEKNIGDIQEMSEYVAAFDSEDRIKALGFAVYGAQIVRNHRIPYAHEYSIDLEVDYDWFANERNEEVAGKEVDDAAIAFEEAIIDLVRAVCVRMRDAGYEDIAYRQSEEYIAECMDANDYLFTEDGKRASRAMEAVNE